MLVHLILLAAAVPVIGWYDGRYQLSVKACVTLFGALQIIGLFSLMHEAAHGHLHHNRRANTVLGEILASVLLTSFRGYRACHLKHHSHFRTEADPQEVIHFATSRLMRAAILMVAAFGGAPFFLLVRAPLTAWRNGHRLAAVRSPVIGLCGYGLVFAVAPPITTMALLSIIGTTIVIGSLNDILYHQGLADNNSLAACSSFDSDVFGQLFLSGANRHAEHHVYPMVPGANLAAVSRHVRNDLQACGAVYEGTFIYAFFGRLLMSPFFLPLADQSSRE